MALRGDSLSMFHLVSLEAARRPGAGAIWKAPSHMPDPWAGKTEAAEGWNSWGSSGISVSSWVLQQDLDFVMLAQGT